MRGRVWHAYLTTWLHQTTLVRCSCQRITNRKWDRFSLPPPLLLRHLYCRRSLSTWSDTWIPCWDVPQVRSERRTNRRQQYTLLWASSYLNQQRQNLAKQRKRWLVIYFIANVMTAVPSLNCQADISWIKWAMGQHTSSLTSIGLHGWLLNSVTVGAYYIYWRLVSLQVQCKAAPCIVD